MNSLIHLFYAASGGEWNPKRFNQNWIRFNSVYFVLFIILFLVEILIALYVRDRFIRPYLGDTLVVILIYCFIRSFLHTPIFPTILAVLFFAYSIEIMQYFNIVGLLGLAQYKLARVVIGTSFACADMVAYTAGAVVVGLVEHYWRAKAHKFKEQVMPSEKHTRF